MSKYAPLTDFLANATGTEIPMTFADIERVTGHPLPASKQYPAWWSNNPSNNVMTKAWLAAGFQTERVDPGHQRLVFRRVRKASPEGAGPSVTPSGAGIVERVQARLGGTVTIPPGVDLTDPSGEVWDAAQ